MSQNSEETPVLNKTQQQTEAFTLLGLEFDKVFNEFELMSSKLSKNSSNRVLRKVTAHPLKDDKIPLNMATKEEVRCFELGVRMAMDKPVVLIKATETGSIFDIDNMLRVYEYNANLWRTTVETDLEKLIEHINGAWENRTSEQTYMKILKRGLQNSE